jgi:S1-C subfamily serine protease
MRSLIAAVCAVLLLSACDVRVLREGESGNSGQPLGEVTIEQATQEPPHSPISSMIERVLPSVVNVKVTALTSDIFGNQSESRGEGSGVVIDPNGVILTNNHVVRGAVRVRVVFTDSKRKPVDGTVIRAIPDRDLAIIKVPAKGLRALTIGHSDRLRLGDSVVAIGFPLGLGGPTVTQGIVSGLNRDIDVASDFQGGESLRDLLQTDAAINPGNSGGALVDLNGRLVGINTAAAQASTAENVGFAIAIDKALPVIKSSLQNPREQLPWLGVQVAPAGDALEQQLDLPANLKGAVVVGVIPGSPAARAGIEAYTEDQAGDVIVGIDSEDISSGEDLTDTLSGFEPGDQIDLRIVSGSEQRTVPVELGLRPATFPTPG